MSPGNPAIITSALGLVPRNRPETAGLWRPTSGRRWEFPMLGRSWRLRPGRHTPLVVDGAEKVAGALQLRKEADYLGGTHREAARAAARRFGLPDVMEVEALLRIPGLDFVYIATPPFLHHPQAMQALRAGKHVLVEKPMALHPAQADEMLVAAREGGLLLTTNLMQRYNPLFDAIRGLLEGKPLGELLHASFEELVRTLLGDQLAWIEDRRHVGGVTEQNGRDALAVAIEADKLAHER